MKRKLLLSLAGLVLALVAGSTGYYVSKHFAADNVPGATAVPSAPAGITSQPAIIGSARPDFSLSDVDGDMRHVSEWDGKVVALNFWATWCPPCIKEIPEFVELQHRYGDQGLQFVGIALQRPDEVTGFMREHGMNYPVLAGEMEVIRIAEAYGNDIGALPYTVVIDRQGQIQFFKRGPLPGPEAEAVITGLL